MKNPTFSEISEAELKKLVEQGGRSLTICREPGFYHPPSATNTTDNDTPTVDNRWVNVAWNTGPAVMYAYNVHMRPRDVARLLAHIVSNSEKVHVDVWHGWERTLRESCRATANDLGPLRAALLAREIVGPSTDRDANVSRLLAYTERVVRRAGACSKNVD